MLKFILLSGLVCSLVAMSGWPWNLIRKEPQLARLDLHLLFARENLQNAIKQIQKGKEVLKDPEWAQMCFYKGAYFLQEIHQRQEIRTPALLRNLGQAVFLADDLPWAVLAFHSGGRLAPNDRVLKDSLEYVRGKVHYPDNRGRPIPSSWPSWVPIPTVELCRNWTLVFYVLAFIGGTGWLMTRRRTWLVGTAIVFSGALLFGLGWWWCDRADRLDKQHPLVVIAADEVPFLKGNGASYPQHPQLPTLYKGMEARRLHQRDDWLFIQFNSGDVGWVHRHQVLVDE